MEVETIKKSKREKTLEIENLGKKSAVIVNSKIQVIKERISSADDAIENTDSTVKEMQTAKASNPKHPGNAGHNEKTKHKDYRYGREQRFTT